MSADEFGLLCVTSALGDWQSPGVVLGRKRETEAGEDFTSAIERNPGDHKVRQKRRDCTQGQPR